MYLGVWYNFLMATINEKEYENIRNLYQERRLSMQEISEIYKVPLDAIVYFFKRHKIPRRNRTESNRILFERKATAFKEKEKLSAHEEKLRIAGVMLYWAEGSNALTADKVDFVNSNPEMIMLFMQFLRKICRIDETKLRVLLYCYANQNKEYLKDFWSSVTNIPITKFTKPYVREDYKPEKEGRMKYGLIHIRYYEKKLLLLLWKWRKEIAKELGVDTKVVKWTRL